MIRSFWRLTIAFAVLFAYGSGVASAQQSGDCNRNCPDQPPSDWLTYTTPMTFGTCTYKITYKARTNHCTQPATYEYELVSIDPGGDPTYCGKTLDEVLKEALKAIVEHNGPGFTPTSSSDPCNNQTVISIASCWFWDCMPGIDPDYDAPTTESGCVIYRCGEASCCSRKYRICWENGKRVIAAAAEGNIPGVVCPDPGYCDTYCDVLGRIAPVLVPLSTLKTVAPTVVEQSGISIIATNDESATLRTTTMGHVVRYDIADMAGAVVLSADLVGNHTPNEFVIGTNGFASGVYVITFRLSDGTSLTKSINIVK